MPLRSSPIQVLGMSRRSLTLGVKSKTPHPYMWCYCSICRKTNGSGGYGINIAAERDTLEFVKGEDKMKIYQANIGTESKPKKRCSSSHRGADVKARINDTFVPNVDRIYIVTAKNGRNGFTRMLRVLIRRCRSRNMWYTYFLIVKRRGSSLKRKDNTTNIIRQWALRSGIRRRECFLGVMMKRKLKRRSWPRRNGRQKSKYIKEI